VGLAVAGNLHPKFDLPQALSDISRKIYEVADNDQLRDTPDRTETFLTDVCRNAISVVNRFQGLDPSDQKVVHDFFNRAAVLVHWAFMNDFVDLFPTLELIFSRDTPLCRESRDWEGHRRGIIQTFVYYEPFTVMAMRLGKPPRPSARHLAFFFRLFAECVGAMDRRCIAAVLGGARRSLNDFLARLFDVPAPPEIGAFVGLVRAIVSLIGSAPTDFFAEPLRTILTLADVYFSLDTAAQLVAGKTFSLLGEDPNTYQLFVSFCQETELESRLMRKDLDPDVMAAVRPAMLPLAAAGLLRVESVLQFWDVIKVSPPAPKAALMATFQQLIEESSPDFRILALILISESALPGPDYVPMLISLALGRRVPFEDAASMIQLLFKRGLKSEYVDSDIESAKRLFKDGIISLLRNVPNLCLGALRDGYSRFALRFLILYLETATDSVVRTDFSEVFLGFLRTVLYDAEEKELPFQVFLLLVKAAACQIDDVMVAKLAEFPSHNQVWHFYWNALEHQVQNAFTEPANEFLVKLIGKTNVPTP
jgi:hypothetical protein